MVYIDSYVRGLGGRGVGGVYQLSSDIARVFGAPSTICRVVLIG